MEEFHLTHFQDLSVFDDEFSVLDDVLDGINAQMVDNRWIIRRVIENEVHFFTWLEAPHILMPGECECGVRGGRVNGFFDRHLQGEDRQLQDKEHGFGH